MIVLQNISKYYYTDTSVTQALRKINLEFKIGEFVAITGESGSGKSTLLNVISGMDAFDDGEMFFCGEPTFQYDAADWENFRRNEIGFVFQNYSLIGHYTTLENIKSALLIMGYQEEEAARQAVTYLEKVGLKGMEKQRASELSSGQKQRLSIARALAKNTSIIVADEPTGNLDRETGDQIIQLLKELSKDKLVLMVTHNYDQAEPYVTRKIRLHDGEVVVDVPVNEKRETAIDSKKEQEVKAAAKREDITAETKTKEWKKKQYRIARIFARMNTKTQQSRAWLFRTFLFLTAVISFVFIGELFANADDTKTKNYDRDIFYQKNDSRLSVRKKDGSAMTTKDVAKLKKIRNVVTADQYDYANDINYYVDKGKDYTYTYGTTGSQNTSYALSDGHEEMSTGVHSQYHDDKNVKFLHRNKFMHSATCITKEDLKKGRLPKNRNEIVLYEDGKKKLNSSIEIYFTSSNIMGSETYYHNKFKVVGVLKEKTSQIYFDNDLCHMLSAAADGDQCTLFYAFDLKTQDYLGSNQFYLVINDKLKGSEARVSRNHLLQPVGYDTYSSPVEDIIPGDDALTVQFNTNRKGLSKETLKLDDVRQNLHVTDKLNDQSGAILEVSEEFFDKIFTRKSTQCSVYIKNYTKTDQVIRDIEKAGYTAVSTYRISSVNYNENKVMDRLVFIGISVGILLVLIIVEILILRSLMKIKIKDFFVMKSMGMQIHMINKISLFEMTRYCIEAILAAVVVMLGLYAAGIPVIREMMIYYGVAAYLCFFVYNLLLEYATVRSFNKLLKGRMAS